jgi:putative Holliday junction resolvase
MRTLAIDPGARRVGLALSDAAGCLATPYDVLQVSSPAQAISLILKVIAKEGVERLVLGIPLNMDGSAGPAAKAAAQFGRDLSRQSAKPLVLIDERLSSFAAEQDLIDRRRAGEKITRKQKKSRLDALAATFFLQAFLDGKLPNLNDEIRMTNDE